MAFSIYQASIPVYVRQLTSLSGILGKAAAYAAEHKVDQAVLLQTRLYPDMFPLVRQVQTACNHAVRGAARLSGTAVPPSEGKEASFEELQALIAKTLDFVKSIDPKQTEGAEDRQITFPVGKEQMTLSGADYLLGFSMPNFYFHMTVAYAILRHVGVHIGKADFVPA